MSARALTRQEDQVIRVGREVVDMDGLAQLHDVTVRTLTRRDTAEHPRHPAPVNQAAAQSGPGGRKRLWDRDQAAAFAAGEPVPALPACDDPQDLLDAVEIAALREVAVATLLREGYLPSPDESPCGVAHWYRSTATAITSRLHERRRPTKDEVKQIREALVAAYATASRRDDGAVNVTAIARAAGVERTVAHKFVRELEQALTVACETAPRQPGSDVDVRAIARIADATTAAVRRFLEVKD